MKATFQVLLCIQHDGLACRGGIKIDMLGMIEYPQCGLFIPAEWGSFDISIKYLGRALCLASHNL